LPALPVTGIPVITVMITASVPALAAPAPALGPAPQKLLKSKHVPLTQLKPESH
jgi:hypothetical protein